MKPTYDQLINGDDAYVKRVERAYIQRHGHPPGITDQAHNIWRLMIEDWPIEAVLKDILGDLYVPPPIGEALFPQEAGRLHIVGEHFYTEDNQLWQWRGFSWFLGFLRFSRGEDITPDLRWFRANGYNMLRVFGPLPWAETPDYRFEHFNFEKFDQFLSLLEEYGLRCNFSIAHYPDSGIRTFAQRVYDVASQHWNVVTEHVNEPHVGSKPHPINDFANVNRKGILASYGLYGEFYNNDPDLPKVLDFGTIHVSRDSAWDRKARHAQEIQHKTKKPWISDEPAKIIEPGFVYVGGKNDPTTPIQMAWHAGICCLWTAGCTVHTEEGKWGRVPQPGMLQHDASDAVRDHVWKRVDPSWQVGDYNGSHMDETSPVDFIRDIWTYSSLHGNKALSVRVAHSPEMQTRNGWTFTDHWGPGNSFATLIR